jgi:outer membrane protein
MKRLYQLLFGLILLPGFVLAQQTQGAQSFTLEQCIQYALENSNNVKNSVLDERIADAKVKETRGIGLPQVSASVGIQHNQKLPRFFSQYNPDQPGFIDLSQVPGVQPGDVVAFPNFFQLKSSGNAAVNISQILFNGSYLVGLQAANAYRDLAAKSTVHTQENTVEGVTKAYYLVLLNKDMMNLYDANVARVDSLLTTTRAMNENGFAERIDVDRLQVTLNNLKIERDNFYNNQVIADQLLKFQMNYPINSELQVVGKISDFPVDENLLATYSSSWDYAQRSDYRVLETSRKLSALNLRNKYASGMPSLAAFANLGYSTQSPNVGGLFKTESAIKDQGTIGPDKWYSFSSFGISLSVPIFSGLQRTYQVQQAKLALQQNENGLANLRSAIDLQMKTTALGYENAMYALRSQRENRGLAENVARVTKIKWEQGVGSNLEVIDAENSLKTAQIYYYNALYGALAAKVELDRAYGKLNPQTSQTK